MSPLAGDDDALAAGEALYLERCADCHGEVGEGDGPTSHTHDPAPSDLTDPHVSEAEDAYLMYRISEGGVEPYNSAMPAFEQDLTEDERWQVIEFIRTLASDADHDES